MSTLKEKLKRDYMSAFKERNTIAKNLLSVINGEIQTLEKNVGVENLSDEEVTKILAKTRKSLEETRSKFPSDQVTEEIVIVESYLPKQMSAEEITVKVQSLIADGASNMGEVMKAFANLPADKKLVGEIYKAQM